MKPEILFNFKVRCDHGLWVSLLHPAIFGQFVDYTLGNLESKST
jgi:hypothetical protein